MEKPAQGTPLLEKITGGIGAVLLIGVCLALIWDAWRSDDHPPGFAFAVDQILPSSGRHLVTFRVLIRWLQRWPRLSGCSADCLPMPWGGGGAGSLDFLAAGEER